MSYRTDRFIEALAQSLPATTRQELAEKIGRKLHRTVTRAMVDCGLYYVRKNAEELRWTIIYVKRGSPGSDDDNRFFILDLDKNPDYVIDDQDRSHIDNGTHSTVSTICHMSANLQTMLEAASKHERLGVHREYFDDFSETLGYLSKRAARLLKQIDSKRAA
jgi:hypothetical protein